MFFNNFVSKNKIFLFVSDISKCVYLNFRPSVVLMKQRSNISLSKRSLINSLTESNVSKTFYRETLNHVDTNNNLNSSKTEPFLESTQSIPENTEIDLGSIYLENLYSFDPKNWIGFLRNAADKNTILLLLTNFQRYIRHLKCNELLFVIEKCMKFDIRDNNEKIDVNYVLLCEILYNFLYKNDRSLSINDICKLTKILNKIKFNKEILENKSNISVPICSMNFEYYKNPLVCENCQTRYGDLLHLGGNDIITLLMVLLGKSLLNQSKDMKKLHENSVVPYFITVGNRNCSLCSHLVKNICYVYHKQFMNTNSIHNISILLHTIKRTKARVKPFTKIIIERLIDEYNGVEYLLDKEKSINTRIVSISQIIQFCINTHYTNSKFNKQLDLLMFRLVEYIKELNNNKNNNNDNINNENNENNTNKQIINETKDNKEKRKGKEKDEDNNNNNTKNYNSNKITIADYPNLVSQLNLLNKCAQVERHNLNRLLIDSNLKNFLYSLGESKPNFSDNYFKTSNIHVQVDAVLKSFNYETLLEHYLVPYIVDIYIPSRNAVIEVDGPYHYSTTINERINKILKRNVESFELSYTLNSSLKKRLLTKSGYKFVNIPYYDWPSSFNEQVYYISNLKI